LSTTAEDISPKSLEFLIATVPGTNRIAVLLNPSNASNTAVLGALQAAAKSMGVTLAPFDARTPGEIQSAFAVMAQQGADTLIVLPDAFLIEQRVQIAELAAKTKLPAIYPFREHVDAGGLMSYGQSLADNYRRAAAFVDKILRGAKPADLPVEQSIEFELVINLKAAAALGLTIPRSMLMRTDKVIE
jgi:putative ABC transport system substrate-binding protein